MKGEIMTNENEIPTVDAQLIKYQKPEEVLHNAKNAAVQLQTIIRGKRKPVIFNGEQYLEFEDWQTVGRFYRLAAKVVKTDFVEYGDAKGFEARAVALDIDSGIEISAAEALCLNDEKNWAMKPLFQLKSMAQTRACAKALRNVLAWVVVLAGFKPTPAEEMTGVHQEELEKPAKSNGTNGADLPEDQLGNWTIPFGKYKGQRLTQIVGQVTEGGKAVGYEYLQWCAESDKVRPDSREAISRFLKVLDENK